MAVHIPLEYISYDDQKKISRELHIKDATFQYNVQFYTETASINFLNVEDKVARLPYRFARDYFKSTNPNAKIYDHINGSPTRVERKKIDPFDMCEGFKLFDYQVEVIENAKKYLEKNGTVVFNVYCSFGKTVTAIYLAQYLAKKDGCLTLITYPRDLVGRSFIGTAVNMTNARISVIGEKMAGTVDPDDAQIIFCMDTRLQSIPQNIIDKVGHLVVDEAHMFCTEGHVAGLLRFQPLYITGLTATYERPDGFHKMLDYMLGTEKIIKINKKPFFVFFFETGIAPNDIKFTSRGVMMQSVMKSLDLNEERNGIIYKMVLANLNEKILILTKHVDHAKKMVEDLKKLVTPYGKTVSLLIGGIKQYEDADIIVGTVSKTGVGYDEKESCKDWKGKRINLLILTCTIKRIEQIAGRVFRAEVPVIFDLVDNYPNLIKHKKLRNEWYISRNGLVYNSHKIFSWNEMFPHLKDKYLEIYNSV